MSKRLLSIALALLTMVGWHTSQAAHLTLPERVDSSIRLALNSEPIDLNLPGYLQVYVGPPASCCANKTPMAGGYRLENQTIIFEPAFSFIENQTYTVAINTEISHGHSKSDPEHSTRKFASDSGKHRLYDFIVPSAGEAVKPAVVSIFPSDNEIPENTLRFYIHFSTPMRPHVSTDYIKLRDSTGAEVSDAFMAFKQELWSEDRRRLTVLMDPGRIKRGVARNQTLGPALKEGNYYSIAIEEGWPSATGKQVTTAFEKRFLVTDALRKLPDTDDWQISVPRLSTREPLKLMFDRAFDSLLLHSSINVLDANGDMIAGTVSVKTGSTHGALPLRQHGSMRPFI
jgi:hypothetical protein